MVSEQSTSASTLMETQVKDALTHTSPKVTLGADATVQGSVASVIHSLLGEPLTFFFLLFFLLCAMLQFYKY